MIKRYDPDLKYIGTGEYCPHMTGADDGGYVDHDDFLAALAAKDAELEALRADAERYRWLRDLQCNHCHLDHNSDPAINYVTAAQYIEKFSPDMFDEVPPDELQKMKDQNSIWCLQIYPATPIGFNWYHGATLDAAIDAAMKAKGGSSQPPARSHHPPHSAGVRRSACRCSSGRQHMSLRGMYWFGSRP